MGRNLIENIIRSGAQALIVVLLLGCSSGKLPDFGLEGPKEDVPLEVPMAEGFEKLNFVMIHLEVGADGSPWTMSIAPTATNRNLEYQRVLWPSLVGMVALADNYGVKLSLAMNPQWGEFIRLDGQRLARLRSWLDNGHELAFHHHSFSHSDWNGYSDNLLASLESDYRGTAEEGFSKIRDLVPGYLVTSGCIVDWQTEMFRPIETLTGGGGKNGAGIDDALRDIGQLNFKGRDIYFLSHNLLDTYWQDDSEHTKTEAEVQAFIDKHKERVEGEVFGVVTHVHDYHRYPKSLERLFEYLNSQKEAVVTLKALTTDRP